MHLSDLRARAALFSLFLSIVACSSSDGASGTAAASGERVWASAPAGWSIVSRAAFTPEARGDTKYFPVASLRGLERSGGTVRLALRATTTIGTTTTNDYYLAKGAEGTSAALTKVAPFPDGQVFPSATDTIDSNPFTSSDPSVGSPIVSWTGPDSFLLQSRKVIDGALYHTCVAKGQPAPVQDVCDGTQRIVNLNVVAYGPRSFETWVRPNGELLFMASLEPGKGFFLTRLVLDGSRQWTLRPPELQPVAFANGGLGAITLTHSGDKHFLIASVGETGAQSLVALELDPDAGTLTERARQSIGAAAHADRGTVDSVSGQVAWIDRGIRGPTGETELPLREGMTRHTLLDTTHVIVFDPKTAAFRSLPDLPRERACFTAECRVAYFAGSAETPSINPGAIVWSGGTLFFWTTESALDSDALLSSREIVVLRVAP